MAFDTLADKAFKQIRNVLNTTVTWLPKAGGRFSFEGIFDDSTILVDPDTEVQVSSNVFTLGFRYADLPEEPVKGDRAIINNKEYKVVEVKEDGVEDVSGVLILHKVC